VSVLMTLSDLERRDTRGQIIRRISLMTLFLFDLERPNSAAYHMDQPRPYRKGAEPENSPSFGVPLYLCIFPLTQNYQIRRGNKCGRGLFFGVTHAPTPRVGVPALPNLGGSFLFIRTPFVAELPNLTW